MTHRRPRVAVVGGGHNGLTAAAYLARAGIGVTVFERSDHFGGAAISARPFADVDANLSRYAYLVSLLPASIAADLGLDVRLARRRFSSYTPRPGTATGLLVDAADPVSTAASFAAAGAAGDSAGFDAFYARASRLARVLWPTLTAPLPTRSRARAWFGADWEDFVERPIGETIESAVADDLVRGVIATDALIGTFASPRDPSLEQNRCLLYHVIGGGTGHWDVPIGGMGTITTQLIRSARGAGATLLAAAEVTSLTPEGDVTWTHDDIAGADRFDLILMGAAPNLLGRLLGGPRTCGELDPSPPTSGDHADVASTGSGSEPHDLTRRDNEPRFRPSAGPAGEARFRPPAGPASEPRFRPSAGPAGEAPVARPRGAQVKANLLLTRLPRLLDSAVDSAAAFGGTFHVHEGYERLSAAYTEAQGGRVPDPLPCEVYCHSLADPSILGPSLRRLGCQTLTVFGLQVPDALVDTIGNDALRARLTTAVLASLDSVLAEPIEPLLALDARGAPCVEVKTTRDLEEALAMPGGHIFHGPLAWPWAEADEPLDTPARRWGVATEHERILVCGAGARRGGGVSGIGGHNAAMAALELLSVAVR